MAEYRARWRKYFNLCVLGSALGANIVVGVATAEILPGAAGKASPVANTANTMLAVNDAKKHPVSSPARSAKKNPKQIKTTATAESKQATSKPRVSLDNYQQLDQETEQLLKDVLNLSSDLAILDEEQNTPAKFQLLVLVTMKPTKLFDLDYVELKIDTQTVAAYNYTSADVRALKMGGGHRLYLALLPAGMHKLSATMAGRIPRDPDYNRAVDYNFISGMGRTVVELEVTAEGTNTFPVLTVKEWN